MSIASELDLNFTENDIDLNRNPSISKEADEPECEYVINSNGYQIDWSRIRSDSHVDDKYSTNGDSYELNDSLYEILKNSNPHA